MHDTSAGRTFSGRVIARTLGLIEANEGQPLFIEDPRNIHADLLRADPQRDTVTRVAARHGIWDFPQFTLSYKALFGESPSRTLRTPPSERRPPPINARMAAVRVARIW